MEKERLTLDETPGNKREDLNLGQENLHCERRTVQG